MVMQNNEIKTESITDWEYKEIGEFAQIDTGKKNTEDKRENGKYNFYVRSQKVEKIDSYSFDGEAVLTAGDGVGVGKVVHYVNGKFDYHQRVYKISNFNGVDGKYFYHYFKNYFLNQILKYTAKSSVDSVRMEMISKMQILLPKLNEQKAIATALSDMDDLILSLEKLINKKKMIKEGAMEELLTGKMRLQGFSETWTKTKVGDIFEVSAGGDLIKEYFNDYKTNKYIYEIYSNSVDNRGVYGYTSNPRFEGNTITVTGRGSIGHAFYRENDYDAIVRLLVLKPKSKVSCYFITQYINKIINFTVESTGVPQLTAPQMIKYELSIPSFEEQELIATILSDMDNEIEILEKKLDKYKNIKSGMMEELLTGKRRLV